MTDGNLPYVVLHKKRGETPLEALSAWKLQNPPYKETPATYAGRLDPMAEGKLLILLGDECKQQNKYHDLDKEYEIEVVFDIGTDTGDALGMAQYQNIDTHISNKLITSVIRTQVGSHTVPYPPYSSKTVDGVPLFAHALNGTLHTITVPSHIERIYEIRLVHTARLCKKGLQEAVRSALATVPISDDPGKVRGADFRQDAIRVAWERLFATMPGRYFCIATLQVTCASGTYMRTLAERLGNGLGTTAFAISIKRMRIGRYAKVGPLGLWRK